MKVLVVGAGPAGVATALLLARYGVDVKLVERERSFARVFRGEGLMPLGIDALFEMGLGGVLETVPGRRVDSWDLWIDGEEVFVIPEPVEELGERAMRVVSQPALLKEFVEEASRCPSFSFERGVRFRDLLHDRGSRCGCRDRRRADRHLVTAAEQEEGARTERDDRQGTDGRDGPPLVRAGLVADRLRGRSER